MKLFLSTSLTLTLFCSLPAIAADPLVSPKSNSSIPSALLNLTGSTPENQLVRGLKEALSIGIQEAVVKLGKTDGFFKDTQVKIPLPDSFKKADSALRLMGQGRMIDDLIATMNRAAEQAVPEAASILGNSVKQMTLTDAQQLLSGSPQAATEYFRKTNDAALVTRFLPIVQAATQKCQVAQAYKQVLDKIGAGYLNKEILTQKGIDIDGYITRKALDGLYLKMAEQEKLIRENPAAQTSDLLKKVFGSLLKK